jgi:hypothetical protein
MVKLAACVSEDVECERLHIEIDGLVVNEELAKQGEVLGVELRSSMRSQWVNQRERDDRLAMDRLTFSCAPSTSQIICAPL